MRISAVHAGLLILCSMLFSTGLGAERLEYSEWLEGVISEAREKGIREVIIDEALRPATPIPQVVSNDRNQAEFVETLEQYLRKRVSDWRVETGQRMMRENRALLQEVAAQYGVQPRFIVAFWGLETNYGNFTGGTDVIRALVTLAYDPRRSDYFRRELFSALQILNEGHIDVDQMKGSWAGAMGQSQFMPSSFLAHAQDFDGDGRRDIWNSRADVFASIAQYLVATGWRDDQTWGRQVQLPMDFHTDFADVFEGPAVADSCSVLRRHSVQLPLVEWQKRGLRRSDGRDLPQPDFEASLILPDGEEGPAFLTYSNFRSILRYNCANNYALAIGHLADRFR